MKRKQLKSIAQEVVDKIALESDYGFISGLTKECWRSERKCDGQYVQIEVDAVVQEKEPLQVRVRAFADDGKFLNAVSPEGASVVIELPEPAPVAGSA